MPLRALLFDLDGTLADTEHANAQAYADALAEAGIRLSTADLVACIRGRHWREFLPPLIRAAERAADPGAIARRKAELYAVRVSTVRINMSLVALLRSCRPHLRSGLVTTASRASANALLECHALREQFDVVVTGDDVQAHKPHPQAYLMAAQQLGFTPSECLAFEDSDSGLLSASRAGMSVVRVAFPA